MLEHGRVDPVTRGAQGRSKQARVDLAPAAQRQLRRFPPGDAARLRGPILALALEPRPAGATKLSGTDFWRVRIGDLRIVYVIDDAARVVVLKVARRSESTFRRVEP